MNKLRKHRLHLSQPIDGLHHFPTPGFVYLMVNNRNGYTKIGYTSKLPEYRERTLQAEEPDIELLFAFYGSRNDEKVLHKKFSRKRLRGEWFDLTKPEQWSIVSDATKRMCGDRFVEYPADGIHFPKETVH